MFEQLSPFQLEILNQHNLYRSKHHVHDLSWNFNLTEKAFELCKLYKSILENSKKPGTWTSFEDIKPIKKIGQNIHITDKTKITGTEVVMDWYIHDEYDYNKPSKIIPNKNDTFTQIIWKNTSLIGAATIDYKGKRITIALYSPIGNIPDEFINNVLNPDIVPSASLSDNHSNSTIEISIPTLPHYDKKISIEILFNKMLEAINIRRKNNNLPEVYFSEELSERTQPIADQLLKARLAHNKPLDIAVKTNKLFGLCVAFLPPYAADVNWVTDHWVKLNIKSPNSDKLNFEYIFEKEQPVMLSPYVKRVGIGFSQSDTLVCFVCLFAPANHQVISNYVNDYISK